MNNDITNSILLVEERGVAAYPNRQAIQDILNYIIIYHNNHLQQLENHFEVPGEYTKQIQWSDHTTIQVHLYPYTRGRQSEIEGWGKLNSKVKGIVQDDTRVLVKECSMEINGYYNLLTKKLYTHTLETTLYHEFNHCYELYQELKSAYKYQRLEQLPFIANGGKYYQPIDDSKEELLHKITYLLLTPTELNASIASVYGNLHGLKATDRKQFHQVLPKLKAYQQYQDLNGQYNEVVDGLSEEDVHGYYDFLVRNGYIPNTRGVHQTNTKRQQLKSILSRKLERLIHGIATAASLYYDTVEDEARCARLGEEIEKII